MSELKALSYVGGDWLEANREKEDIINPYSGETIGTSYLASTGDIEHALTVAQQIKTTSGYVSVRSFDSFEKSSYIARRSKKNILRNSFL